jgi:hypothetical protein
MDTKAYLRIHPSGLTAGIRTTLRLPQVRLFQPIKICHDKESAFMPEVIFPGPEGRLEGRYHPQKGKRRPDSTAIATPHPQFRTMNNRKSYAMHYAFYNMGFTARFFNSVASAARVQANTIKGLASCPTPHPPLDSSAKATVNSKHCWWPDFHRRGSVCSFDASPETGFISASRLCKHVRFRFALRVLRRVC